MTIANVELYEQENFVDIFGIWQRRDEFCLRFAALSIEAILRTCSYITFFQFINKP